MPNPMTSEGIGHNANKIDPNFLEIDFIFVCIEHNRAFHSSSFWYCEGIEWMSIIFILSKFYFYKYYKMTITHNDINFSSFDLVVSINDFIIFTFEIFHRNIFTSISDGAMRCLHIIYFLFFFWGILVIVDQDLFDRVHSRLLPWEIQIYHPYHIDLLSSQFHIPFLHP